MQAQQAQALSVGTNVIVTWRNKQYNARVCATPFYVAQGNYFCVPVAIITPTFTHMVNIVQGLVKLG
jgi:hypothetical protein